MKRVVILLNCILWALMFSFGMNAQESVTYKVLFVNSPTIKIGSKNVKQGDVFTYPCEIEWENKKQAFRAINVKSGKQQMFFASAPESHRKELTEVRRMSTRNESVGLEKEELAKLFGSKICMLDTVVISTPLLTDENHYFKIRVKTAAFSREYKLPVGEKGEFVLPREILADGKKRISRHLKTDVLYYMPDDIIEIINDVQIEVFPINF